VSSAGIHTLVFAMVSGWQTSTIETGEGGSASDTGSIEVLNECYVGR
jgi:hypothetical protein